MNRVTNITTPVLLVIYNRPEITRRLFGEVRRARPSKLYISADGPQSKRDAQLCAQALSACEEVDWECDVRVAVSPQNKGACVATAEAIDWVMSSDDRVIVLEDDCIPEPSFFPFCENLLKYYEHDSRVMEIGGANYNVCDIGGVGDAYIFSRYAHTHGWGTWKRAWGMNDASKLRESMVVLRDRLLEWGMSNREINFWMNALDAAAGGFRDSHWDFQWQLVRFLHGGLAAIPIHNLIRNIGYGESATHTKTRSEIHCDDVGKITIINHPVNVQENILYDQVFFSRFFGDGMSAPEVIVRKILRRSGEIGRNVRSR